METNSGKSGHGKVIAIVIAIIVVIAIAIGAFLSVRSRNNDQDNSNQTADNSTNNETDNNEGGNVNTDGDGDGSRILVAYFSAQGHTADVAQQIAEDLGADTFQIAPVDEYTEDDLDYSDDNSRVGCEYNDESLRDVELTQVTPDNWDEYDTVLIGYPIWWGMAAWPVNGFVTGNDFTGKTVIPFCTSASSSIGSSDDDLAAMANGGDWLDGQRFNSNASADEIQGWVDSLNL